MFLWPGILNQVRRLPKSTIIKFIKIGIIVAVHWLCFYGSIKLANASVALITMSSTALFTALIEPYVFKKRLNPIDVFLSILVIPAMYLTTYDFDSNMLLGFWLGILSAVLLAYFTILNRKLITHASPEVITFLEMGSSWFFLSLCSGLLLFTDVSYPLLPNSTDIFYLITLSLGCTILPFVLHLKALKHISAFATNLIVNLEPVYGIVMAAIILKEYRELNARFYIGVIIIIVIVMLYPLLNRSREIK